jgi:hypothetical protein
MVRDRISGMTLLDRRLLLSTRKNRFDAHSRQHLPLILRQQKYFCALKDALG